MPGQVTTTQADLLARIAPWLPLVHEHGGNPIDRLFAGRTLVDVNAPLALIETAVQAQVRLLARLDAAGLLREPPA